MLDERGSRYGTFKDLSSRAQLLKATMFGNDGREFLDPDMVEALEVIATKIARILNGDPCYVDNWVDIAGYATLVADRLEGKVR
jgi:hypothetical protein